MIASERVVIEAPMSFTGSGVRIWRLSDSTAIRWLVLAPLIVLAWAGVTCWYMVFGLWLVPYRLVRRSQRKQKRERLRHEELIKAVQR